MVTAQMYESNYGGHVLRLHKGSPYKFLKSSYPEIDWKPYRFASSPKKYWVGDDTSVQSFLDHVKSELSIQEPDDWYRVSLSQLASFGGKRMILANGGSFLLDFTIFM